MTRAAVPVRPADDSVVLERTRTGPLRPEEVRLRKLRAAYRAAPQSETAVLELLGELRERARNDSDPRYLSAAQGILNTWASSNTLSADFLVHRAGVRQSLHHFQDALSDLDGLLRLDPRRPDAWLMKCTLHTLLGDFAAARTAAIGLIRSGNELLAVGAAAQVGAMTGDAARSLELLNSALERSEKSHPTPSRELAQHRLWAGTLLAEIAGRIGRPAEAERRFRQALKLHPSDPYALGAFSDLLLDLNRPDEVIELLRPHVGTDGLLLRIAEAEIKLEPARTGTRMSTPAKTLAVRFEAARARGDSLHQREEARFLGRVLGRWTEALDLAIANWKLQKEPADLRILAEAAVATRNSKAIEEVRDWIQTHRYEDRWVSNALEKTEAVRP